MPFTKSIGLLLTAWLWVQSSWAAGTSWISPDFPPKAEAPEVEQAQQWALCAATLEVMSDVAREQPGKRETADAIQAYASGARAAILGVFVQGLPKRVAGKSEAETQKMYQAAKTYALMASDTMPSLKKTELLSQLESAQDKAAWLADLNVSAAACLQQKVLAAQKSHIEAVQDIFADQR